jgi:hypothetical protein
VIRINPLCPWCLACLPAGRVVYFVFGFNLLTLSILGVLVVMQGGLF